MKYLILALLLLSPLHAAAEWSGVWLGRGVAAKPDKPAVNCREILLRLEESPTRLKVLEGHYLCGAIQASFDPAVLDRRGGELFYRGKRIGTLTRDTFTLDSEFEDGSTYSLRFERTGNDSADYAERWTEEGKTVFKVDGRLRRQQ